MVLVVGDEIDRDPIDELISDDDTGFEKGFDEMEFWRPSGLDENGEAALQRYVNLGGNFVAIHAASDCQRNSTFLDKEIGSWPLWFPYIVV